MEKVSVVIPNYNGKKFLNGCLRSLENQSISEFETILVDDGSTDGSVEYVKERFPKVRIISLKKNGGICRAVNRGIQASETPYVILLNNDVEADRDFVREMLSGIRKYKDCFSCSAQLRNLYRPDKIDDAGDYYCALGWAFALGKDRNAEAYQKTRRIFASCGGAAIYRRELLEKIGCFDEILDTGRASMVMKTGICQKRLFTMRAAAPRDRAIMNLRCAILQETACI